jgi:hypothetical protein
VAKADIPLQQYQLLTRLAVEVGTLHDTGDFGVATIGESDSSDGLDLAKGTIR